LRVRERDGNRGMSLVSPPRLGYFRCPPAEPRWAHHATNELPLVVNGLYEQLDQLRKLYGSESIEEILAGIINR
jgi:hypothetical protein